MRCLVDRQYEKFRRVQGIPIRVTTLSIVARYSSQSSREFAIFMSLTVYVCAIFAHTFMTGSDIFFTNGDTLLKRSKKNNIGSRLC